MICDECTKGQVCKHRSRVELEARNMVNRHAPDLGLSETTQRELIEKTSGTVLDQCVHCDKGVEMIFCRIDLEKEIKNKQVCRLRSLNSQLEECFQCEGPVEQTTMEVVDDIIKTLKSTKEVYRGFRLKDHRG